MTTAAIDSARSQHDLLTALLTMWRTTRSPRVADAIERIAPAEKEWLRIGKKPASRVKTAIALLAKNIDDPRLASLYVTWLAQGQWPAPTAKELWSRAFAHLVALNDSRTVDRLRAIAKALPSYVGTAYRAWMVESIEHVANQIAKPKPDSRKLAASLDRISARLGDPPKPVKQSPSVVESVWSDPDDHDLRQVIADALLECADPRGEFIAIQLRGKSASPAARKRAADLEKKHAIEWLGAIGKIVTRGHWRFENGFPSLVQLSKRLVPRRDWEAALLAPEWSTIRTLRFSILTTPKWWVTAWVKSPATRHVRAFEWAGMKDKQAAFRIERESGKPWRVARVLQRYRDTATSWFDAFAEGLDDSARSQLVAGWRAAGKKRD